MSGINSLPVTSSGSQIGDNMVQPDVGPLWTRKSDGAVFAKSGTLYPAASYPKAAVEPSLMCNGRPSTTPPANNAYTSIATNGSGTWVAVANGQGSAYVTTDGGNNWTTNAITFGGVVTTAHSVVWHSGQNRFIAFGNTATQLSCSYSTNGTSWTGGGTLTISGATADTVVAACDGTIAMVTWLAGVTFPCATTTDGTSFVSRVGAGTLTWTLPPKITVNTSFGVNRWILADSPVKTQISTAADGSTWTTKAVGSGGGGLAALTSGGGTTIMMPDAVVQSSLTYYTVASTPTGTWTTRTWPGYVVSDSNTTLLNGLLVPAVGAANANFSRTPNWLHYDGTRFVSSTTIYNGVATIQNQFAYSTDGINWTFRQLAFPSQATGGGVLVTSTGTNLILLPSGSGNTNVTGYSTNWITSSDYVGKSMPVNYGTPQVTNNAYTTLYSRIA